MKATDHQNKDSGRVRGRTMPSPLPRGDKK